MRLDDEVMTPPTAGVQPLTLVSMLPVVGEAAMASNAPRVLGLVSRKCPTFVTTCTHTALCMHGTCMHVQEQQHATMGGSPLAGIFRQLSPAASCGPVTPVSAAELSVLTCKGECKERAPKAQRGCQHVAHDRVIADSAECWDGGRRDCLHNLCRPRKLLARALALLTNISLAHHTPVGPLGLQQSCQNPPAELHCCWLMGADCLHRGWATLRTSQLL